MNRLRWAPLAAIPAALAGWLLDPAGFLAGYLVAWWCWVGLCMGVLANGWLHTLSGGAWGQALQAPVPAVGRSVGLAALLFLPVLGGLQLLYPWSAQHGWDAGLAAPAFKRIWLSRTFFTARAAGYLVLWCALAWRSLRSGQAHAHGFAAAALIIYGLSVGMASMDWIMSLMPLWYSSVFGLVCGVVQMLGGMALAILLAAPDEQRLLPDLGNLLLMYVLSWAYLEYVQFLIIWAANLPHEILWYTARAQSPWLALDWLLVIGLFVIPLLALVQRTLKRQAAGMKRLALLVLAMVFVHACWLVLPSLPGPPRRWLMELPLAAVTVGALALLPWSRRGRRAHG